MRPLYPISTFIASIPLVVSTSTFLLVPHESELSLLQATRGVSGGIISSWYLRVDSTVRVPAFSDFTVHVFVNHDPFIASVLLPDLFSEFSESAWRLPQEIATPRRPEVPPKSHTTVCSPASYDQTAERL